MNSFKYPWRIEVRATLFHPYRYHRAFETLEAAMSVYRNLSPRMARIRAN